jgi:hypothetical protein
MEAGVFTFIMLMSMSALGLYQAQAESFRTTFNRILIAYGMSLLLIMWAVLSPVYDILGKLKL